jgi:hypothetical protein
MEVEAVTASTRAPLSRARVPLLARVADALDRHVFVVLAIAAAGLIRVTLLGLGIGSDTWYTLVGGRVITHTWLPHADTLAVMTRGREWVDEQWLAHLLLYGLWSLGGWPLALLILVATYLGAFVVAAATALRHNGSARSTALVTLVALMVALGETGFRAETLAFLLFAVVLMLLLDDEARSSRRVYLAFPLLVLWANIHGSVVLGAALVSLWGLTLAVKQARSARSVSAKAIALTAVPWLCTVASPYALELPGYYVRLLHNPTLSRFVSEWQPTSIRNQPLFFVLLLAALLLVGRARRMSPFSVLVLLLTAVGGMLAVRHVVWFALASTAVLPSALDEAWRPRTAPRRRRLNIAIAVTAIATLALAMVAYSQHDRAWFERGYPARAGDAVAAAAAADPGAQIFATERYADWLLFEHPELAGRVAYDVRFELLTQPQLARLARFRLEEGPDWLRVADNYRLFVVDPVSDAGAIRRLVQGSSGRVLYRNPYVAVVERAKA